MLLKFILSLSQLQGSGVTPPTSDWNDAQDWDDTEQWTE